MPITVPETVPEIPPEPAHPLEDKRQQFVADMKTQLSGAHTAVSPDMQERVSRSDPYREPIEPAPVTMTVSPRLSETEIIPPDSPPAPASTVLEEPTPSGADVAPANDGVGAVLQEAVSAAEPNAVLTTPEVTKGLEQLLSEWDLFKSSGIFGLGAGGREHPLYKKLAALSVTNVVSGRWEGAEAKSVTNIKEYMDGWKKQWGIEADSEESFETYLRRVIAQILNLAPQNPAVESQPLAA